MDYTSRKIPKVKLTRLQNKGSWKFVLCNPRTFYRLNKGIEQECRCSNLSQLYVHWAEACHGIHTLKCGKSFDEKKVTKHTHPFLDFWVNLHDAHSLQAAYDFVVVECNKHSFNQYVYGSEEICKFVYKTYQKHSLGQLLDRIAVEAHTRGLLLPCEQEGFREILVNDFTTILMEFCEGSTPALWFVDGYLHHICLVFDYASRKYHTFTSDEQKKWVQFIRRPGNNRMRF